jgi:hypothetical protein
MAPAGLVSFLALSSLKLALVCLFGVAPANALSTGSSQSIVRRDHALLSHIQRTPVHIETAPEVDPLVPRPPTSRATKTGKVGLAWPNGDNPSLEKWAVGQASWYVIS